MAPPQDTDPARAEIVTRSRMAEVWERGRKDFPYELNRRGGSDPASEISWMAHYTSLLIHNDALGGYRSREWLWRLANSAASLLDGDLDVLARALEEYSRAAESIPA